SLSVLGKDRLWLGGQMHFDPRMQLEGTAVFFRCLDETRHGPPFGFLPTDIKAFRINDDDCLLAMDGHLLRLTVTSSPYELRKAGFGVLQLPTIVVRHGGRS